MRYLFLCYNLRCRKRILGGAKKWKLQQKNDQVITDLQGTKFANMQETIDKLSPVEEEAEEVAEETGTRNRRIK